MKFLLFFQKFSKNLDLINFTKFEIVITIARCCRRTLSQGLQIFSQNLTAQVLLNFDIRWFFEYFSKNELNKKKRFRGCNSQPYSAVFSGYSQRLQILHTNLIAQIILVVEICSF